MKKLIVSNNAEWRKWLTTNHNKEPEIWLVYYKKARGKTSIEYETSVEEALCFGWVDNMIKRLDDEKYARKFTPRKDESNWSESNKRRALKMITQGLMTTQPETRQRRIAESIRLLAQGQKLGLK